jgi:mRNA-degrading endonuclease RelE of RelBE toxin-antitoxin system
MTDKIQKYFLKLSLAQRKKIDTKLEEIEIYGIGIADVKPLKTRKGLYRLRIGKLIRIIFYIENEKVIIVDADNRDSIYK